MKRRNAVLALVFLLMSCATVPSPHRNTVPIGDSPQQGPANAPIVIVEFLDYT